MRLQGNGLRRCPICGDVIHEGERTSHLQRHGTWKLLLWRWDSGDRGIVVLYIAGWVLVALWPVMVIREWLGL